MSRKTIRGYDEKLRRYVRLVGGSLGDLSLQSVRQHLTDLQGARKWEGHPLMPTTEETLSSTTVRNHGRVLSSFANWLQAEGYTEHNVLSRLKVPKANEIRMEP